MESLKVALFATVSLLALAACDTDVQTMIDACVSRTNGAVRIVDPGEQCRPNERPERWARQGPKGDPGERGADGARGERGDVGAAGPAGLSVRSGSGAPAAELGRVGEFYVDFDGARLYGPKTGDGWGDPVELVGPAGAKGDQGPQGNPGERGDTGPAGVDGVDGNRLRIGTGIPFGDASDGDLFLDEVNFTLWGRDGGL